jgi:chromosomal replication initiation ATPase DnaA
MREKLKAPKQTMAMLMLLAEDKGSRIKEEKEKREVREAVLTGILADVAEAFEVPLSTVVAGDQQEMTVFVRSIYYFVARIKTDYGMIPIVRIAGRKDHTGLIHHLKKIRGYIKTQNHEFISLWNHYLTVSQLFTEKDF